MSLTVPAVAIELLQYLLAPLQGKSGKTSSAGCDLTYTVGLGRPRRTSANQPTPDITAKPRKAHMVRSPELNQLDLDRAVDRFRQE